MKTLTLDQVQLVSGGCPTCLLVPGGCIIVGAATTGAAYFGLGQAVAYTGGALLLTAGAYLLYQKLAEKNFDVVALLV